MSKNKFLYSVKKIKGTEAVYGVFFEGTQLVYEGDRTDCISMMKSLNKN